MTTNPYTKRKTLPGGGALYIAGNHEWEEGTTVKQFNEAGCFENVNEGSYETDEGQTIVVEVKSDSSGTWSEIKNIIEP